MTRSREPFILALERLRDRLRRGDYAPGQPIVVLEEARRLGLSTTPVREALAWLAGEGLVQCGPVNGYLAPGLDAALVRDRYAFRLECLVSALGRLASPADLEAAAPRWEDPVPALRERFHRLVQAGGNAALADAFGRVGMQLSLIEEAEARLFADHLPEAQMLLAKFRNGSSADLRQALDLYHARRIAAAPLLVLGVGPGRVRPAARAGG